jgi:AraC-like DNA-binding protein
LPLGALEGKFEAERQHLCTYDIRDLRVLNGLKLETKHKAVLWALDSRGANIYPNQKTIASDCGMSPSTVQRAIHDLAEVEVIYVHHRKGTSNSYKINRNMIRNQAQELRNAVYLEKAEIRRENEIKTKDWDIK